MKGLLLDTHVVLWWLIKPNGLSPESREAIANPKNRVWVSAAAIWEMAIKKTLGRLEMPENLLEVMAEENFEVLSIQGHHALAVSSLPLVHQDPFDRMQIAQSKLEDLTLVTRDENILKYKIRTLKA